MAPRQPRYKFVGTEKVVVDQERLERALRTWAKWLAAKAGQGVQGPQAKKPQAG